MPKTVVRRAAQGRAYAELFDAARRRAGPAASPWATGSSNDPEFLLVPRAANAMMDRIASVIRQARRGPTSWCGSSCPQAVQKVLEKDAAVGSQPAVAWAIRPTGCGWSRGWCAAFLRNVRPGAIIVEGAAPRRSPRRWRAATASRWWWPCRRSFSRTTWPRSARSLRRARRPGPSVEVNSWGGWLLARQAGVRMESGPGLPVLNCLAARVLKGLSVRCVTASLEADRRQLEESDGPFPVAVLDRGLRPAAADDHAGRSCRTTMGKVFEDRRGVRMTPRRERGLDGLPAGRALRSAGSAQRADPRPPSGGRPGRLARPAGRLARRADGQATGRSASTTTARWRDSGSGV